MFIRQAPWVFFAAEMNQMWPNFLWKCFDSESLNSAKKICLLSIQIKKRFRAISFQKKILVSDFFGFCHNIETYWERGEWAKISRVMDRSGFVDRRRQRRRRRWRCCHPSRLNCQLSSSLRRFDVVTKSGETNWVNDVWTRLTFSWILNFSSNFLG